MKHTKWQLRLSGNYALWLHASELARLHQCKLCMFSCWTVHELYTNCMHAIFISMRVYVITYWCVLISVSNSTAAVFWARIIAWDNLRIMGRNYWNFWK